VQHDRDNHGHDAGDCIPFEAEKSLYVHGLDWLRTRLPPILPSIATRPGKQPVQPPSWAWVPRIMPGLHIPLRASDRARESSFVSTQPLDLKQRIPLVLLQRLLDVRHGDAVARDDVVLERVDALLGLALLDDEAAQGILGFAQAGEEGDELGH